MALPSWKRQVLAKIKPSKLEEKKLEEMQLKALKAIQPFAKGLEVVVVGSVAKGTWLRGTNDIDIFVKFPVNTPREVLERKGLDIGKKTMKALRADYEIDYAEHPYVSGRVKGYWIEIVPCYNVASAAEIKSAVDRSPFHLQYVLGKISEEQKDEVRLLKAFCHAHGIYGADTKTEGFSGYLCELLILKHNNFETLMESASHWIPGLKLGGESPMTSHSKSKDAFGNAPLVFIDPVDPKRNVAAAVSMESFIRFVNAAKEFCGSKPNSTCFFPRSLTLLKGGDFQKIMRLRETQLYMIVFRKPEVIEDTLYPQLRRFKERIFDLLRRENFHPIRVDFIEDAKDVFVLIEAENGKLPAIQRREGPNVNAWKNALQFREKYANAHALYIENDTWVAEVNRKFTDVVEFLQHLLPKNKSKLESIGIPSYVAGALAKGYAIREQDKIAKLLKSKVVAQFLYKYFHKKL